MRPRALRGAGRLMRLYQRSGPRGAGAAARADALLPADLRRLEPQAPRDRAAQFSNRADRGRARRRRGAVAVPRRAADRLRAGSRLPRRQPRHGRRAARQRLRGRHAAGRSRAAARCTRTTASSTWRATLARRMIDLVPAGALRRDHHATPAAAARTCGTTATCSKTIRATRDAARAVGREAARHPRVAGGDRLPARRRPRRSTSRSTVTYHESCHLAHGQKISRQPRALLRLLPGVSLVELPESSWCCGSAGIYALTQPEQADALLQRKVATRQRRPARRSSPRPIPAVICRSREG